MVGRWLQAQWQRRGLGSYLLWPASLLFRLLVTLRRSLYRSGKLGSYRAARPVIVVGNISVGGTGKTPLIIALAHWLKDRGYRPLIVSRGYGGSATGVRGVLQSDDPAIVGDEPLLLAQSTGCPVWVGAHRPQAIESGLAAHPDCNVVLSDDGLQHYRMQRDFEIVVIDGRRGFGNGALLPAGPLREPLARLREVDAIVINGVEPSDQLQSMLAGAGLGNAGTDEEVTTYSMALVPGRIENLAAPGRFADPNEFRGRNVHAVAGIGDPQRFFDTLSALGIESETHAFADHHHFSRDDLDFRHAEAILMTGKDAVKCRSFAEGHFWVLAVDARWDEALGEAILEKIRTRHGSEVT